ncbi:MAG: hypothetical protein ACFHVJ_17905 [Aestuariibacter sp.]
MRNPRDRLMSWYAVIEPKKIRTQ